MRGCKGRVTSKTNISSCDCKHITCASKLEGMVSLLTYRLCTQKGGHSCCGHFFV